jgi:hypothetical protein
MLRAALSRRKASRGGFTSRAVLQTDQGLPGRVEEEGEHRRGLYISVAPRAAHDAEHTRARVGKTGLESILAPAVCRMALHPTTRGPRQFRALGRAAARRMDARRLVLWLLCRYGDPLGAFAVALLPAGNLAGELAIRFCKSLIFPLSFFK